MAETIQPSIIPDCVLVLAEVARSRDIIRSEAKRLRRLAKFAATAAPEMEPFLRLSAQTATVALEVATDATFAGDCWAVANHTADRFGYRSVLELIASISE